MSLCISYFDGTNISRFRFSKFSEFSSENTKKGYTSFKEQVSVVKQTSGWQIRYQQHKTINIWCICEDKTTWWSKPNRLSNPFSSWFIKDLIHFPYCLTQQSWWTRRKDGCFYGTLKPFSDLPPLVMKYHWKCFSWNAKTRNFSTW